MHPALSVIIFTTLSGAGYGLLAVLGLYGLIGLLPASTALTLGAEGVALGAVTIGLLSSTSHLGHPERSWRAFSQWRTSWLSREGVASVFSYLPALAFGAACVRYGNAGPVVALTGGLTAIAAIVTTICTAYIYRSLKPIQNWNNNWVLPNYLLLAGMSGMLLFSTFASVLGADPIGALVVTLVSIVAAFACKIGYFRYIDSIDEVSTPESATGLGGLGKVRSFEAPHTSENYLLKEMGYRIARKHSRKLRTFAVLTAFGVPFVLVVLAMPSAGMPRSLCLAAASISAVIGILVERWLFFAEAKHTVTLYYGRPVARAEVT